MARKRVGNKRERIINAAARLFGEKGYHRTTTSEIADAAGVAAGTIYIYFSSKEMLIVAVFEEFLGSHMHRLQDGVDAVAGPEAKTRRLLTLGLELMESNPASARIFLSQLRQSSEMIKAVAKRSSRAYKDIIEGVVKDGVSAGVFRECDPVATAVMIFGAYQNVVLEWVAADCSYHLGAKAQELSDFVLTGMACKETSGS
ncbi:TetR/AcrR family transcriptional regulator [bacterium]|nr:TetR/AcrR family transcriptional regulator [bacterium]